MKISSTKVVMIEDAQECLHENAVWHAGYPQTRETPEEPAGWDCPDCGEENVVSPAEREMAKAEWLYDPFEDEEN